MENNIDFRYRGIKTRLKPISELKTEDLKRRQIEWAWANVFDPIMPEKLKEFFKQYLNTSTKSQTIKWKTTSKD